MATKRQSSAFEKYAHEYDLITNAVQREKYHQKEVDALIARFHPRSILDAGCASGLTAMLFGRRGVAAVGLDRSRRMIKVAKEKFKNVDLPLEFRWGDFERLPKKLHEKFDLVVCLANSISGVNTLTGLKRSLKNFRAVLKPGGHLVLQMLNYAAVKEDTLFPIKVTENNGIVYERFSERRGSRIYVYVIRLDLNQKPPGYEIFRHESDNYNVDVVSRGVAQAGFAGIHKFGDLYLKKRFGRSSRDLVIIGRRPGR